MIIQRNNYNIINGHTIINSPTVQSGCMVVKTLDENGNIIHCNTLKDTSLVLMYKHVTMPGEPEIWSIPFRYLKYGETMKECAIKATEEYLKFPLMEQMLSNDKTLLTKVIIDDSHTGSNYYYAPLSMMFTYQLGDKTNNEFIDSLYKDIKSNDTDDSSSDVYDRAIYITDRYFTNQKISSYNEQKSINHKKVADIRWISIGEIKEMLMENKFDNATKWCLKKKIYENIF